MPTDRKLDPATSTTFCVLPWIHTYFSTDGLASLCCISPDPIPAGDGSHFNVNHHRLADVLHSPAMDAARRAMLEGKQVHGCSACYDAERSGTSLRQHYNTLWQRRMPELLDVIRERQEKAASDKPLSIDVRFGNLCNLRCQICNPHNSSQIERDDAVVARWNDVRSHRPETNRFGGEEWFKAPAFEAELAEFGGEIRHINLGGGEPSISKPAQRWLEHLIETGRASQIEIYISTNMTNVNPRFFDLVAQFKRAHVYPSIDGFGPLNDYLRYPSKWHVVERNIERLRASPNIEIAIAPVISAYNALSIAHLFDWADGLGFDIYAYRVRAVDAIDCALIPEDARQLAVQRMREFLKTAQNPKPGYSTIEDLCRYLESPIEPAYAAACREKFHRFTFEVDQDRGMRFEDYGPEMAAFLGYSSRANRPPAVEATT